MALFYVLSTNKIDRETKFESILTILELRSLSLFHSTLLHFANIGNFFLVSFMELDVSPFDPNVCFELGPFLIYELGPYFL